MNPMIITYLFLIRVELLSVGMHIVSALLSWVSLVV